MTSNPCTDVLTDLEYLEHMIPHHQVAVDMSELLIPTTINPDMLHLCRNIIRKQKYEIWEMEIMKAKLSDTVFSNLKGNIDKGTTKLEYHNPILSKSKDGDCDPLFFKPDDHAQHMMHMEINDNAYLEHMIPHHQVAVDMSNMLIPHTNNPQMLHLCREIIYKQNYETK